MIQAFLDEGGTDDDAKIVVMAGFLASYRSWRKFQGKWEKVLNPDGGHRVFHATDCLGKNGYGDFEGWPKQERNDLVDALIPIIKKFTRASFCCAFSTRDYEEVVPEWIRKEWTHPYYLCMYTIVNCLDINRSKLPPFGPEKLAFTFERKPKYTGILSELYDDIKHNVASCRMLLGKMTPDGDPAEDIPLQAADLLCYLSRTFHEKDYFHKGSAHPRTIEMLNRLKLRNHLVPDFLDREALKGFARIYAETKSIAGEWPWVQSKAKRLNAQRTN